VVALESTPVVVSEVRVGLVDYPFVSIIIVNYSGGHFLPACLNALRSQTYPQECFEVIISDNGSKDHSLELIQRDYKWVRLLENDQNLGFASGNNVAIKEAAGKYVVLLNNDTSPTPQWLENLVRVAEERPEAGMVTGRLLLFYNQIELTITAESHHISNDERELGVQIFEVEPGAPQGVVQYLDGFYGREPHPSGSSFRWTKGRAILGVPVPEGLGEWCVTLQLSANRPTNEPVKVDVYHEARQLSHWVVTGPEPLPYKVTIPASVRESGRPLVQNTGSVFFRDGAGRDRGTYVQDFEVFYEYDENQYSEVEEVFAGCGASLLLRKKMLDEVGLLDDDFFMYYEDTDLAWRARLGGWKVLYAPEAIVRHIHCGSSGEWSPFFLFHVERNRLAMVFKNGTPEQILYTWGKYIGRAFLNSMIILVSLIKRQPGWRDLARWPRHHAKVISSLIVWLPALIRKRARIQARRRIHHREIYPWFVG
jgi:GT2 family glycosyltransferase